jgi:hypothetical protein
MEFPTKPFNVDAVKKLHAHGSLTAFVVKVLDEVRFLVVEDRVTLDEALADRVVAEFTRRGQLAIKESFVINFDDLYGKPGRFDETWFSQAYAFGGMQAYMIGYFDTTKFAVVDTGEWTSREEVAKERMLALEKQGVKAGIAKRMVKFDGVFDVDVALVA